MSWLDLAVQTEVIDVVRRFGRDFRRAPSAHHTSCPACSAERRHPARGDRRGAVGIAHSRPLGWHCFACSASGDAVDYASYVIGGARFRDLDGRRKAEIREWFERAMGVGSVGAAAVTYRRPAPTPSPAPSYPPFEELRLLCANGLAAHSDPDCSSYLEFRGIDARAVWQENLAFGLPWSDLPDWARVGEINWARSKHRLIVPLYDARGLPRSCLARSVERAPQLKSCAPRGYGRAGLLMANRISLMMLRRKARPAEVIVREGEIDFLSESADAQDVAVLGIVSGSWTAEIASRIPDRARVVVATDADEAGDKYAHAIAATLAGRVLLERRRVAA